MSNLPYLPQLTTYIVNKDGIVLETIITYLTKINLEDDTITIKFYERDIGTVLSKVYPDPKDHTYATRDIHIDGTRHCRLQTKLNYELTIK